jgi:hypothetical protein
MEKSIIDWGVRSPIASSRKKTQPGSWLMTSGVGGALVFTGAMALMWRDAAGLPVPAGDLGLHLGYALKTACHMAWPQGLCIRGWCLRIPHPEV